ncbi:MAG: hypothetical protein ABIR29_01835 [Chthoniobacterales bacterium]
MIAGCAAPPQPAGVSSAGGSSRAATVSQVDSTPQSGGRTVWVPPPTGSLLGGGYVRVASDSGSNDEPGLVSAINTLNAAAGSKTERPFVVSAVSRVSGLSAQQLMAQQDRMQVRFGELLAFNTIARNHEDKVRELASLKAKGQTWSQLAQANAISVGSVAKTVRNANDLTASSFNNNADRAKGGTNKLKSIGLHPQARPGN